jgi:dTDP-4-dehydrorhamnose 3,5-epimerase
MNVIETAIPGILIIEPEVFGDARGFFMETFQADRYAAIGIVPQFVQDNFSHSRSRCRASCAGCIFKARSSKVSS